MSKKYIYYMKLKLVQYIIIILNKDKFIDVYYFENEKEENDYVKLSPLFKDNNNEMFHNSIL